MRAAGLVSLLVGAALVMGGCGGAASTAGPSGGGSGGQAASGAASSPSASAGGSSSGLLQQGLAFYRGKTVTIISPVPSGHAFDLLCREVGKVVASYLHATVNVEDIATGGTVGGQDRLAASAPDGLTLGLLDVPAYVQSHIMHTPGVNFNPANMIMLANETAPAYTFVASPSSPYKTYASLLTASPTPTFLTSGDATRAAIPDGIFGIKAKYLRYKSAGAAIQGFLRGDGPLVAASLITITPPIANGKGRPILLLGTNTYPPKARPYVKGVPTLAEFARQHPPATPQAQAALKAWELDQQVGFPFAVPGGTPPARVAALRAAVRQGMMDAKVRAFELTQGMPGDYVSAAATTQQVKELIAGIPVLKPFAGG